jgi:hypothetical protein
MKRIPRAKPKMGDALIINLKERQGSSGTFYAIAKCECGKAVYTAVSGSHEGIMTLLRRKHVAHLANCSKQAELFALDSLPSDCSSLGSLQGGSDPALRAVSWQAYRRPASPATSHSVAGLPAVRDRGGAAEHRGSSP